MNEDWFNRPEFNETDINGRCYLNYVHDSKSKKLNSLEFDPIYYKSNHILNQHQADIGFWDESNAKTAASQNSPLIDFFEKLRSQNPSAFQIDFQVTKSMKDNYQIKNTASTANEIVKISFYEENSLNYVRMEAKDEKTLRNAFLDFKKCIPAPNFFFMLPITANKMVDRLTDAQNALLEKSKLGSACMPPNRFHFTLNVLCLGDSEIDVAVRIFEESKTLIHQALDDCRLRVYFDRIGFMLPQKRVVYAYDSDDLFTSSFRSIVNILNEQLTKYGLQCEYSLISSNSTGSVPHLTLMNAKYAEIKTLNGLIFDSDLDAAEEALSGAKGVIEEVRLCAMFGAGKGMHLWLLGIKTWWLTWELLVRCLRNSGLIYKSQWYEALNGRETFVAGNSEGHPCLINTITYTSSISLESIKMRISQRWFTPDKKNPNVPAHRRLCSVIRTVLGRSCFVHYHNFTIDDHVSLIDWPQTGLPPPAGPFVTQEEIRDLVSHLMTFEKLTNDRPRWRLHVVQNVISPDGRVGSVWIVRVDHRICDGISLMHMVSNHLLNDNPDICNVWNPSNVMRKKPRSAFHQFMQTIGALFFSPVALYQSAIQNPPPLWRSGARRVLALGHLTNVPFKSMLKHATLRQITAASNNNNAIFHPAGKAATNGIRNKISSTDRSLLKSNFSNNPCILQPSIIKPLLLSQSHLPVSPVNIRSRSYPNYEESPYSSTYPANASSSLAEESQQCSSVPDHFSAQTLDEDDAYRSLLVHLNNKNKTLNASCHSLHKSTSPPTELSLCPSPSNTIFQADIPRDAWWVERVRVPSGSQSLSGVKRISLCLSIPLHEISEVRKHPEITKHLDGANLSVNGLLMCIISRGLSRFQRFARATTLKFTFPANLRTELPETFSNLYTDCATSVEIPPSIHPPECELPPSLSVFRSRPDLLPSLANALMPPAAVMNQMTASPYLAGFVRFMQSLQDLPDLLVHSCIDPSLDYLTAIVSNVPGPANRLICKLPAQCPEKTLEMYSVHFAAPTRGALGLGFAGLSYGGYLRVTCTGDAAVLFDVDGVMSEVAIAFQELRLLCGQDSKICFGEVERQI